jgi:hypothetical protein
MRPSDYDKLMEGRDRSQARLYSPKTHYNNGDLIQHAKFGLGLVTALKGEKKIELIFPDGPRVLVHAPTA